MSSSYNALCTDFYVNQKLGLKMDLPRDRNQVLDMFDRVRRQFPTMDQFRRYRDELALETVAADTGSQWLAIRNNNIRSGYVNPAEIADAYTLHAHVLEIAPFFLSISALDVDYQEILFGFDLAASGNHDEIVFDALIAGSPLSALLDSPNVDVVDCQPVLGLTLAGEDGIEAQFEVKTRPASRANRSGEYSTEPISVYLTLRKYGPVADIKDLTRVLGTLRRHGEELLDSCLVPHLLRPIRDVIGS